jgi:hypothetical protein
MLPTIRYETDDPFPDQRRAFRLSNETVFFVILPDAVLQVG